MGLFNIYNRYKLNYTVVSQKWKTPSSKTIDCGKALSEKVFVSVIRKFSLSGYGCVFIEFFFNHAHQYINCY
jgi:hypothetical protein